MSQPCSVKQCQEEADVNQRVFSMWPGPCAPAEQINSFPLPRLSSPQSPTGPFGGREGGSAAGAPCTAVPNHSCRGRGCLWGRWVLHQAPVWQVMPTSSTRQPRGCWTSPASQPKAGHEHRAAAPSSVRRQGKAGSSEL